MTCPTTADVVRFVGVARMQSGRFTDDEYARKEGLPGAIVPGNMSLGFLSRMLTEFFPAGTLKELTAKNQLDKVKGPFGGDMMRLEAASMLTWHSFDHYGQMVVYARMNGVVPGVSMFMGALWNRRTTKTVGRNALKYFSTRRPALPGTFSVIPQKTQR